MKILTYRDSMRYLSGVLFCYVSSSTESQEIEKMKGNSLYTIVPMLILRIYGMAYALGGI